MSARPGSAAWDERKADPTLCSAKRLKRKMVNEATRASATAVENGLIATRESTAARVISHQNFDCETRVDRGGARDRARLAGPPQGLAPLGRANFRAYISRSGTSGRSAARSDLAAARGPPRRRRGSTGARQARCPLFVEMQPVQFVTRVRRREEGVRIVDAARARPGPAVQVATGHEGGPTPERARARGRAASVVHRREAPTAPFVAAGVARRSRGAPGHRRASRRSSSSRSSRDSDWTPRSFALAAA